MCDFIEFLSIVSMLYDNMKVFVIIIFIKVIRIFNLFLNVITNFFFFEDLIFIECVEEEKIIVIYK